jgi:hypothetical protein
MPLNGNPCQTHATHAFMTTEERLAALEAASQGGSVSGSVSWGGIGGTLANQTDLQTALDAKGTSNFSGAYADLTGKPTLFDGNYSSLAGVPAAFTPAAHDQAISTITGLQAALDGKQAAGSYEPANANIQAHVASSHAPSNAQKNSDITKAEIEAKLIGEISSHTHASSGGSDPWTYLRLANDFTTTSASAVDVTGLGFTPAANQRYEFVGRFMVRTATATVGPRPGLAWATGLSDGVAFIQQTSSATANVFANGNITASVLAPVGGVPTTTGSWPALIEGQATAGATPSGSIRVQLASETAGTTVTMKAGSFLKYRTVP